MGIVEITGVRSAQSGHLRRAAVFDRGRDKVSALSKHRLLVPTFMICLIENGTVVFASSLGNQNPRHSISCELYSCPQFQTMN